uniref:Uncharacterized protein n=1 Tax=Mimivirus LCMiAC02 TaxID=2506609 RepID=A0A481Z0S7_9VIRU|nr:MAG: uncharacterized protein LCMiAC02_01610 [Mimivirus LCMiAC02]
MNNFRINPYNKIYPKGRNGRQCIGPCYKPGEWIIHPITLDYQTNDHAPFCPTEPWSHPMDVDKDVLFIDECKQASENIDRTNKLVEYNIILPQIDFDCKKFLKIYYKIFSFENAIVWINKHKHSALFTKLRILECAWKSYGYNIDVIDDSVVNLYIDIIKRYWIKTIYENIGGYVHIKKKQIYFSKHDKKNNNKYKIEKINFILKKLITKNNVYKFLVRYIKKNMDKWNTIDNINNDMLSEFISYLSNKIEDSV